MKKIGKIYKGIIFFLDEFHHGAANHVIHFAGFTLLGYGLATQNLFIVMLSPLVMEAGHIYNYSGNHYRTRKTNNPISNRI